MSEVRELLPYSQATHPILYGLGRFAFGQYLKFAYDIEVYGNQYLSDGRQKIFAPTHHWHMDPEISGVSVENQSLAQMAKSELWTDEGYKKFGVQLGKI